MNSLAPINLARDMPSDEITVVAVTGLEGFRALRKEWDSLFRRAAEPHQLFQSFAFLDHWASSYVGDGSNLVVIAARAGESLVGVLPLLRRRRFGVDMLQVMGAPVSQFDDMIVDPAVRDELLPKLWSAVEQLGADLLELRRVREDGALWHFGASDPVIFETMQAPFADLARRVDGDQPGPAYSSKDRSNYRRRIRRLAERGTLVLRSVRPGPEASSLARQGVELKKFALERGGVYSRAIGCSRFLDFFAAAASDPASALHVSTIELDGKPIGIDLSFLSKDIGFGHVLATDGAFEKEGLGQLLVHHVFSEARRAGARRFDLLAPADQYKLRHADGATKVESRIFGFTAKGRIAARFGYALALPMARRLAARLPAWMLPKR